MGLQTRFQIPNWKTPETTINKPLTAKIELLRTDDEPQQQMTKQQKYKSRKDDQTTIWIHESKFKPTKTNNGTHETNEIPYEHLVQNTKNRKVEKITNLGPSTQHVVEPLSSLNEFSGYNESNHIIPWCFNSTVAKPYPNPSGKTKAITENVSWHSLFSLRP